ncbi:dnaJ, mitochondrial-like [Raphidocelis subcapitata]|uniref:DnaJ, mitochondrial-like n=1 Tax=Raphidocelis subcapitata TaxID=307507 RepID=A0A2V0NYM1_9CHLO|nr:dnaJ, mitochondrial-like [Raphidocelis subcapitata]|eukprot:GBF91772.1 dnaJ, mitochondrial-like [Raphidocelis subcapitata]
MLSQRLLRISPAPQRGPSRGGAARAALRARPPPGTLGAPPRRSGRTRAVAAFAAAAGGDYYEVLGVPRDADKKAIKAAYRSKARKYHPDVNKEPGAEETFKRIGEAYEAAPRCFGFGFGAGAGAGGGGGGGGGGPAAGAGAGFAASDPFSIFEQFFGGGGGGGGGFGGFGGGAVAAAPVAGEDQRVDLSIGFEEAVFGCRKDVLVERMAECAACAGSGARPGAAPQRCGTCGGSGRVVASAQTPAGVFQQVSPCPSCGGRGETADACEKCGGEGRVLQAKTITVTVPPGVNDGSRLRLRGEGGAGLRGGPPGDLYVFLSVRPHPELSRDGADILSDLQVPFYDAVLGAKAPVATVDGPVDLKIPPGTQPGTTLVLRGRGAPRLGRPAERGAHRVRVRVGVPRGGLSEEQRRLVERLRELGGAGAPAAESEARAAA